MSAADAFEDDEVALFREVVGRRDPSLLASVMRGDAPSRNERSRVADVLAAEFEDHVSGPGWEPSEHGKKVDDLLGRFFLHFPIEPEP